MHLSKGKVDSWGVVGFIVKVCKCLGTKVFQKEVVSITKLVESVAIKVRLCSMHVSNKVNR